MWRQVSSTRRFVDTGNFPFAGALHSKSRSSPLLSVGLILLGAFLLIAYAYSGHGIFGGNKEALNRVEGDFSCTLEVQRAIPILKKAYGDSMHKVLHVGPDTCSVVFQLLKEEETEAWGVEPYDIEDADAKCKNAIHKGIVRVADIKFPLPYRSKSFSLVIASDALDYLSPKYLNRTLPELARVASDGLVIFAGQNEELSWWIRFFVQTSLDENEAAFKKFEQAASKRSYKPACQVFHLNPYH
ncbi:hypothetical protein GH714_016090 [Hevea brasiliensis]|uniref:Methyltransferase type 11 domain-containing protein n=1 Tax=Hevea brasiliensis TaxID=3981 RepID=A0A6A6K8P1_HEVBR|nr:hypothetical protein GH714_016090 [Hevea brasiliensis]